MRIVECFLVVVHLHAKPLISLHNIISSGLPHFIVLYFIVLHGCCSFYKSKARAFTSKNTFTHLIVTLSLLWWSGTQGSVSLRYECNLHGNTMVLLEK